MAWDITPSPQIQPDAPAGRDSLLHVAALRLEVVACIPRLRHNRSFEFGWGMGGLYSAYRVHRARPREPGSWVAVDRFSGAPLLRLHNYDQLQGVCSRLG